MKANRGRPRRNWTHPICDDCWTAREPEQEPVRLRPAGTEVCCFCGTSTDSGIYVREDPSTLSCRGDHG